VANKYGYFVITLHVEDINNAKDIAKMIDTLLSYNIKGIILNSLADVIDFLPIHKYLQSLPVPLVMVERTADIYNVNKVLINAREAMCLAVRYLVGKGHRNIVFSNTQTNTSVEKSRIEGFFQAAESFVIRYSVTYVPTPTYNSGDGYEAIGQYLESNPLPGAIIAADSLLVGMMQHFYQRGIHVPQDVSMIGLDDTFSLVTSPKLTTIAFPEKQMSETAIDLILKHDTQDKEMSTAREILLSPYLIERDSVLEAK
jgi:LacI family transcriptional regulator